MSPISACSFGLALWLGSGCLLRADEPPVDGNLDLQRWNNVAGQDLRSVLDSGATVAVPSVAAAINLAETTPDDGHGFLTRLRGRLVAPVAGEYRFHIASNDQSELWLGTAEGKFTKRKIASVPAATGHRDWTAHASQDSGLITLAEDETYYFEVLMHAAGNANHLSVGWVRPGETAVEVIPGKLTDETVVLKRFVIDPDDLDDDDLPDSWETSVGLDAEDNGQGDPANGAYGDTDNDGFNNLNEWLTGGNPFAAGGNAGYVNRDIWTGLTGSTVLDLTKSTRYPQPSNDPQVIASNLDFGTYGDNYGQRISGMIVPPYSGNWRFWIVSDGASELQLSDSAAASGKRKIAQVNSATTSFDTSAIQKSEVRVLTAGTPYYFEVLHKESTGADHVKIAWAYEPTPSEIPVNHALASNGATATQSSTLDVRVAARGNDGIINSSSQTAHTANLADSWWQVDMGQDRVVRRVVLFNRTDSFKTRFSNFRVSVLDASNQEVTGQDFYTTSGYVEGSVVWQLPAAVTGRKVKVQILGLNLLGNGYLSVAECQVFSSWPDMADRQIVAAPYLQTPVVDSLDQDADSLPDAWELAHGLDPADNGAVDFAHGEYGDLDGDFHTNRDEFLAGTNPSVQNTLPGKFRVETWQDVLGYSVADLIASSRFYGAPDIVAPRDLSVLMEFPGAYYGTRTRGYVTPAVSGEYTFWVSARTSAELWLSTDVGMGKYAKKRIAALDPSLGTGHGIPANAGLWWDRFLCQKSAPVHLEAGQTYYLEVIHQHGHGDRAHASVAWAVNDGSRVGIPSAVSSTYVKTADDLDDDYLPDAWENQYGLNPADNGAIDPAKQGERGDFDGDGLSNREEFLLGTDPTNPDSDGDGVNDGDEIHSLGTNPLVPNVFTDTLVGEVNLGAYTGSSTAWTMTSGGLLADSFRGEVTWDFTVPTDGNWLLWLQVELMGSTFGNEQVPIVIKVDGKTVIRRNVHFGASKMGMLQALTPWLAAGTHQVTVLLDNSFARRTVRLVSLKVYEPADAAALAILTEGNQLIPRSATTRTSPVFIEGHARDTSTVTVNGVPVINGIGKGHWFANVPLADHSDAQTYAVHFEQGCETSDSVAWQATNVMDGETLTIRQGDSIRAGAWGSDPAMTSTITLSSGGSWNFTGAQTAVLSFPDVGTFTVNGSLQGGANAALTVKVIGAPNFPSGILDVMDGRSRTFSLTAAQEVVFDAPSDLCRVTVTRSGTNATVSLLTGLPDEFGLAARLSAGGPILAVQRLNVIGVSDALENDLTSVASGGIVGYKLFTCPLTVLNLPEGGRIEVVIYRAGVMFPDGSTLRTIHPAEITNGSVNLQFLFPLGMAGGYCHSVSVYDRNGVYLGTR